MSTPQPQIAAANLVTLLLAEAVHLYLTAGIAGLFLGPFAAIAVLVWKSSTRREALLRHRRSKYPIGTSHESGSAGV